MKTNNIYFNGYIFNEKSNLKSHIFLTIYILIILDPFLY